MNFDIEFAKLIAPILTIIVGGIIKLYRERRAKVISYIGHVSAFTLRCEEPSSVYTHSVIVRNTGRKAAKNIRLGHNFLPDNLNVFPSIKYTVEKNPAGASEILIPILVPKEQVTVSYLYFPPITWDKINTYIKYDDGLVKSINVIPIAQPSKRVIFLVWFLMLIGASYLVYWLIRLLHYLL